jgi:hypothetical protein
MLIFNDSIFVGHNHARLRAREDGVKPSPLRDCRAEEVGRAPLLRCFVERRDTAAGRPRPAECRQARRPAEFPSRMKAGREAAA